MSIYLAQFEEKNRREAAIYTAIVSAIILSLFYFITIFKDADIVKPDYGIEVNFGTSDLGSGNIQTYNKANDLPNEEESAPEASKAKVETPAPPLIKPVESKPEKVKVVKEAPVVTSKVESDVKIKETKDTKAKPTPAATKPVETSKPAPVKAAPVKPTPIPPKPDAGSLYSKPGAKTGGNGTVGTSSKPGGNNNGDGAKGEVGDKGDPKGKIDAPLYSGKPGGGGGSGAASGSNSLNLTGWTWSKKPVVNDNSDETGNIRFEIKVDDQGQLLSVKVLNATVSQSVVNLYKRAIEKVSFVATGSGNRPSVSTGTINIKINPRN